MTKKTAMGEISHALPVQSELSAHNLNPSPTQYAWRVRNIASAVKSQLKMGKDTKGLDTEFIYARVLGIMASSRETVSIDSFFPHELAPLPTALFDKTGDMRTTSKAVLKNKIQILSSVRNQPGLSIRCGFRWM